MPKFTLCCSWAMSANVEVEADTLEEAYRYAVDEMPLPDNGEYVDSSFEVLTDVDFGNEEEG